LAEADVVISTSNHESYGASIVEALAAGVPVVSPEYGIAKEAGAITVEKSRIGEAVVRVLSENQRGNLKLKIFSAGEWAEAWRETLI
jgi:glycosyltransferase involved in cell wall biosynthesis